MRASVPSGAGTSSPRDLKILTPLAPRDLASASCWAICAENRAGCSPRFRKIRLLPVPQPVNEHENDKSIAKSSPE